MLFKNANIFVGGKFRHGSFRAENGRFTEILTTVPAEGGIDLNDQYVTPGEVPTAAITMGVGTVMAAKKIVMVITGADKADILYKVFFGPVTPEVPGSILQFHHDVTLICDEAAARFVEERYAF